MYVWIRPRLCRGLYGVVACPQFLFPFVAVARAIIFRVVWAPEQDWREVSVDGRPDSFVNGGSPVGVVIVELI